jgi:hypothetical protein
MPIYEYVCRSCGAKTELHRLPRDGVEMRHLVPIEEHPGVSRFCGTFRRDYSTINVNRVPGGGRD